MVRKGIKTITNKYGGTLAGFEEAVETANTICITVFISLPVFTDDDFRAHAYWNKNCMQMASSLEISTTMLHCKVKCLLTD